MILQINIYNIHFYKLVTHYLSLSTTSNWFYFFFTGFFFVLEFKFLFTIRSGSSFAAFLSIALRIASGGFLGDALGDFSSVLDVLLFIVILLFFNAIYLDFSWSLSDTGEDQLSKFISLSLLSSLLTFFAAASVLFCAAFFLALRPVESNFLVGVFFLIGEFFKLEVDLEILFNFDLSMDGVFFRLPSDFCFFNRDWFF